MGWMYEIKAEWVHQQTYTTVRKKLLHICRRRNSNFLYFNCPRPKYYMFIYNYTGHLLHFFVLNILIMFEHYKEVQFIPFDWEILWTHVHKFNTGCCKTLLFKYIFWNLCKMYMPKYHTIKILNNKLKLLGIFSWIIAGDSVILHKNSAANLAATNQAEFDFCHQAARQLGVNLY